MSGRAMALTLFTVALAATSAASTAPLQSQEAPRRALVIGGLSSVGVLLPIGSQWVLRPDIALSGALQYMGGISPMPPQSSARIGAGISALRLLDAGTDSLRPYLVARLGYLSIRASAPPGGDDTEAFEAQAALGGGFHFQPSDRFGLFVELVADYALQRNKFGGDDFPRVATYTRWQLRPALGVTLRRAQQRREAGRP